MICCNYGSPLSRLALSLSLSKQNALAAHIQMSCEYEQVSEIKKKKKKSFLVYLNLPPAGNSIYKETVII